LRRPHYEQLSSYLGYAHIGVFPTEKSIERDGKHCSAKCGESNVRTESFILPFFCQEKRYARTALVP
jgi:hypothetical protein